MHSHITHLYALLETAKEIGVPHVYIHFFGDGRDTAPRSAAGYAQDLLDFLGKEQYGEIATVVGRYYAKDRDKRWERVKIAVDGLVKGEGEKSNNLVDTIKARYEKDETDEFLKPIILGNSEESRIKGTFVHIFCKDHAYKAMFHLDDDTLFFFNYRSDRMREIASVFGLPDKPMEVDVPKNLVRFIDLRFRSQDSHFV